LPFRDGHPGSFVRHDFNVWAALRAVDAKSYRFQKKAIPFISLAHQHIEAGCVVGSDQAASAAFGKNRSSSQMTGTPPSDACHGPAPTLLKKPMLPPS
jgi:hypothetical protein